MGSIKPHGEFDFEGNCSFMYAEQIDLGSPYACQLKASVEAVSFKQIIH